MKKIIIFLFGLTVCFPLFGKELTLDQAINDSAVYFNSQIPKRAKVAVTNFGAESYTSRSGIISEYIIDELEKHLVNNGSFSMVDRQNIDKARNELQFNMSGEVSDESAQRIGRFLGAQVVIFGSIKPIGNIVRFQVRAIGVESAEIVGIYTGNVRKNDITRIFGRPSKTPQDVYNPFDSYLWDEYKEHANRNYWDYINGYFLLGDDGLVGGGGMMLAGGIHWSPIPLLSIGAETAFGGGFNGEYYGTGSFVAGLVFPLKIKDTPTMSLFFDGILEIGIFGSYTGLIAKVLTPSVDAGLSFRWDIGFDIKYKRTFLDGYAINSINAVLLWGF